jgi:hypothetical protein
MMKFPIYGNSFKKMFQTTNQKTVYSLVYVHPTFLIPTKPQPAVTASGGKITNKRGYQQKRYRTGFGHDEMGCTLWQTNIAMENHNFQWENPL